MSLYRKGGQRTVKKTGATTVESRHNLANTPPDDYREERRLALIGWHWGGVEIRKHWRRDATLGEDRSRSRHANPMANLTQIRRVLSGVLARYFPEHPLPQIREQLHSRPAQ